MKTINKTIIFIELIEDLEKALMISETNSHQFTAQELVNRRSYLFGEWQEFEMSDDLRRALINQIVESLGGQKATKRAIWDSLYFGRPQHWGLNRMLFSPKRTKFSYCAGQDYTWETQQIRNALK